MTRELELLLPFHTNGSLDGEEKALVEETLKYDFDLQREAKALNLVRSEIKCQKFENSPGELGLKRLKQQIGDESIVTANDNGASFQSVTGKPWLWRGVAVAACLALVLQMGYFLQKRLSEGELEAASGITSTAPAAGSFLKATFVPDAKEQNIRALLLSLDITIVGGPSSLGVYILSTPRGTDEVIENLRRRTNLVATVQRDDRAQTKP